MLKELISRVNNKPLFISDELPHYATVLAEQFHTLLPVVPTDKHRRSEKVKRIIDEDLCYATVRKTRQDGKVIKVDQRIVYGKQTAIADHLEQSPSQMINTAYIERTNLDWRLWDAHLTRKAPTAARAIEWLKSKFAICVACYNLIRPHETLSRGADRVFRPKTPAMAAGVTDHRWTFGELLTYPALCQ